MVSYNSVSPDTGFLTYNKTTFKFSIHYMYTISCQFQRLKSKFECKFMIVACHSYDYLVWINWIYSNCFAKCVCVCSPVNVKAILV